MLRIKLFLFYLLKFLYLFKINSIIILMHYLQPWYIYSLQVAWNFSKRAMYCNRLHLCSGFHHRPRSSTITVFYISLRSSIHEISNMKTTTTLSIPWLVFSLNLSLLRRNLRGSSSFLGWQHTHLFKFKYKTRKIVNFSCTKL